MDNNSRIASDVVATTAKLQITGQCSRPNGPNIHADQKPGKAVFGCDEGAGPGWITPKKDEIGLCPVLHLLSKNLPNAFQIQNSPTKNIIHLVAGCWGRNRCAALVHLKRDRDGQAGEIELTSSGDDSDRRPVQVLQVQAPFALKPSCTQKAKTFDLMKAKDVGPSIWVPGRKPGSGRSLRC